jgi:predicted kinase
VVRFALERNWLTCDAPAIKWPAEGRPSARDLANSIDAYARRHSIAAISIDGPQGWRDPARPLDEGVGRQCERDSRTPGKTGDRGITFPRTYLGWTTMAIELFDLLSAKPGVVVANEAAAGQDDSARAYLLLECFPTSTWRTLGLQPLPSKAKRPNVEMWAEQLGRATGLSIPRGLGHDDLQAVVSALPAAALLGAPLLALSRGLAARKLDGHTIEGLIWDAAPAGVVDMPPTAQPTSKPLLVVVSGPPGSGKTTIAEALRERLGLPLLAKDRIKESLGGSLGIEDRAGSHRLGVAVFELIGELVGELLAAGVSVIAEGNFTTETRFLSELPPSRIVQVHVTAPPAVLHQRLLDRDTHRHPVHYDREAADEIASSVAAGQWDALPLDGVLVRVGTEPFPNLGQVTELVVRAARDSDPSSPAAI